MPKCKKNFNNQLLLFVHGISSFPFFWTDDHLATIFLDHIIFNMHCFSSTILYNVELTIKQEHFLFPFSPFFELIVERSEMKGKLEGCMNFPFIDLLLIWSHLIPPQKLVHNEKFVNPFI